MKLNRFKFIVALAIAASAMALNAFAFSPAKDTAGPLTITIADPGEVKTLDQPLHLNVSLRNSGTGSLTGSVHLTVIDDWRVEDAAPKPFTLAANATQSLTFTIRPGKGSYAALYPIHAFAEFQNGAEKLSAHAVLIASVSASAVAAAAPGSKDAPVLRFAGFGRLRLDAPKIFQPAIALQGTNIMAKPAGWQGADETTGASVQLEDYDRGDRRHAIGVHPAWRKGWGDVWLDYRIALPNQTPLALDFATAIRDNSASEPPSDGVEFRVQVNDGAGFKTVFTRFSAAKRWETAHVDLSAYAGHEVTLRLVTDPGPAHNTVCDQSFWAEPTLASGTMPAPESDTARISRRQHALAQAKAALHGAPAAWSWKLASDAGTIGAAVEPGPAGLADAFIAFADGQHELVFDGFAIQVDGQNLGAGKTDMPTDGLQKRFENGRGTLICQIPHGESSVAVEAKIWAEAGALRVAFTMPGAQRDLRGEPRFTLLALGAASEAAHRVYAGFGNVLQDPGRFDLSAGGFTLSTRHVGMDFEKGLSFVQACDVFPDRLHVDPDKHAYALVTHHDATFSFIPSVHGAFTAARVYQKLVQFKPAGGVANLLGKMCLDQWGGDYGRAAKDVELAARYGLTNAVFVKHVWQRWGYDYRLPDIYPPEGSFTDFRAMVEACKRNGLLFCPHDNYIDFYPDATGYSYEYILFNADGTPQKAWFNHGRDALSYRWSPNAFGPWLEANLKQVKAGFAPTAYFVDVFSAMPPIDFYDRQGRFFPKTVTAQKWGGAFDRIREVLGNNTPTISEAGQDGLIGHLDAGESDHSGWLPDIKEGEGAFRWNMKARDGERIPWHDMASHGSFVLLAGGLGPRYAGGQDETLHGYGSDDYLSLTVLGGRNPMCDGPFSRRAVMTYWLLHDVCNQLAHSELLAHEFAGDDIHRQISHFSSDALVRVNRGKTDWATGGATLPIYGFLAKAGDAEAGIIRRDGIISAYAKSPGMLFVDARPNVSESEGQVFAKVASVEDLGNRRFRFHIDWQVLQPVPAGFKSFVHFVGENGGDGEGILFQGGINLDADKLSEPGTYPSSGEVTIPANVHSPADIGIRFGLYHAGSDGRRLPLQGPVDRTGRAKGGSIHLENNSVRWQPEAPDPTLAARTERLNMTGKAVDFGPMATSGAFRLAYHGQDWQLIPLPGSPAFKVELRLNELNASGKKVSRITAVDANDNKVGDVKFQQDGQVVRFVTAARVFGYRLQLAP